jgi:hypothetical protein
MDSLRAFSEVPQGVRKSSYLTLAIAGAEAEIPGAGHNVNQDNPNAFNRVQSEVTLGDLDGASVMLILPAAEREQRDRIDQHAPFSLHPIPTDNGRRAPRRPEGTHRPQRSRSGTAVTTPAPSRPACLPPGDAGHAGTAPSSAAPSSPSFLAGGPVLCVQVDDHLLSCALRPTCCHGPPGSVYKHVTLV